MNAVSPKLVQLPQIQIEIIKGSSAGKKIVLNKPSIFIGRGQENDIVINDDPQVSRRHVEIKNTGFEVTIVNVSQKNKIFINQQLMDFKLVVGPTILTLGDTDISISVESKKEMQQKFPIQQQAAHLKLLPENTINSSVSKIQPQDQIPPSYQQNTSMPRMQSNPNSGRIRFYGIIAVVALVGYFLFGQNSQKNTEDKLKVRSSAEITKDLESSESNMENLQRIRQETGKNSEQYKNAQQNYVKGFRDYRQGQYSRAMQSFQAAISIYPNHVLARKYYKLAQIKFGEQVQFNMMQGRRYRSKGNYRLCKSAFEKVIIMVKDPNDPIFKEAKQLLSECQLQSEGRY